MDRLAPFLEKHYNTLLLILFIFISSTIILLGNYYKKERITQYETEAYAAIADSLTNDVITLIEEKQNATLTIALALAQSDKLANLLIKQDFEPVVLHDFSMRLREETDFKNVWIQLIDQHGISRSRSWTKKRNDDLSLIREDVRSMINRPQVKSSISVGRYDMTFKAMTPIYNDASEFVGFIEVITHFNSIANKIAEKGFEPVILVNSRYKRQITNPFTKTFVGDHYVANKNVDLNLLNYIHHKGLDYFISPHMNYFIDPERKTIVINHTLFDTQHNPMANFLLFKPLAKIDKTPISSIASTINLYMLLLVVITGFIIFQISNTNALIKHILQQHYKLIVMFTLFYLVLGYLFYTLLVWDFEKRKSDFLTRYSANIVRDYQIIYDKFSTVAQTMFRTSINTPDVLELMADVPQASRAEQAELRKKLYDKLIDEYEFFKEHELRQLHFHLPNNDSFLRFHRPEKFGDNLTNIRSTVAWTNANQRSIDGFEEGRIFNGFRHLFPLFSLNELQEKEHIGSVEISFSPYAITKEFAKAHRSKSAFLIKAKVVDAKVFSSEQLNYTVSPITGFYYDTNIKDNLEHAFGHTAFDLLTPSRLAEAAATVEEGRIFTIATNDGHQLFSFIPLKNPVTKKVVAMMVIQSEDSVIAQIQNQFIILLAAGLISILLVFLYIYRELSSKYLYQKLLTKTQEILDAQSSIVFISNGSAVIDCNKVFLDFFGYASLQDFRKEHECICELFIENDRYFHLGKVPEEGSWIHTIEQLPQKEQIISMPNTLGQAHAFTVNISRFDSDYVITLADISDTMTEQISLEKRATHDQLTGAFNRDYFEHNIARLMQESIDNNLGLGIILFDIDHFKIVNDTHGHERGDAVLRMIVDTVNEATRREDTLIRWGGEEFLLIVKTSSDQHLMKVAENIRRKVNLTKFIDIGHVSCSFGITLYHSGELIDDTIKRADLALYEAKTAGRNQVIGK